MAGPTVELFSTSILSNVKVRTRHERYTSVLAIKKIPYVYHDLASDDDAKSRWRRKAKDPQLPGILVNNEWVGSFDDFEEAVEFGELELFLGVSPAAAQATPPALHPAQSAVSSKDPSLYPTLPYAAEGAGRWKEPDAEQFISSLNIKEDELTDADVDAMLADIGKLPVAPASSTIPEKKYVPSKEATIKPLRLAKMGPTTSHQRMPSGSPSPSPVGAGTRASPMARYSATQRSTRALAAEAAALTSNRKTSGALLREAVSQGKTLDDAMEESRMKHIISEDNIDDLFASLGLSNVDIGDDEVDQFLEQGAIPQGLRLGGDRVHRSTSIADKARDQTVARDLARKAKEKGHASSRTSLSTSDSKLTALQPANTIGSTADIGSADFSTDSSRTPILSSQLSAVTQATSSEAADAKLDEASQEQESKADDKVQRNSPVPSDAMTSKGAADPTGDVSVASADSAHSEPVAEQQPKAEKVTDRGLATGNATPKVDAISEIASRNSDSTTALGTAASQEEPHGENGHLVEEEEEPKASGADVEAEQKSSKIASTAEDSPTSKANDESESSVKALDGNGAKSDIPAVATPDGKVGSVPTITPAAKDASDDTRDSGEEPPKIDDDDRTPTKDLVCDPLESEDVPQSSTAPAAKDDPDSEAALEHELAQAARIASTFQDPPTAIPTLQEQKLVTESPGTSDSLDVTSATEPEMASATAASTDAAPSPVHIQANEYPGQRRASPAAMQKQASSSRQASSSSRKAIDVSRPIDPADAVPQSSPPQHMHSDPSTTSSDALAKRKKMGILGFGRDKHRDTDKETEVATKPILPGERRHERTISQILREADAVLQSDDCERGSDSGDDDEGDTVDSAMVFGSATVEIDAARAPALRSSSRQF